MSVVAVILLLAVLIFVHELGHFLAARLQGIYANRFSIGFGPVLWKYQGAQTEYALRALPLGGFVGFPDDDPDSTIPPDDPNLLRNRPVLDRTIVISAGVIANLLFAYFVLVAQLGLVGLPSGFSFQPGVLIPQVVSPESAAAQAGLKDGDLIIAIDNQPLPAAKESVETVKKTIETSPGKPLTLTIQRDSNQQSITLTPRNDQGVGRIGVQLAPNGNPIYKRLGNPVEWFTIAANEFQRIVVLTVQGFWKLISNFKSTADQVSGPVGIVVAGAKIAQNDLTNLFSFAALISVNLAVINILPLPALDGGQLAFLFYEALRGKPLPTKIQEGVMQTGLVLLLGLGIFLIVRDTFNLIPIK
jgi:membrane-associated protease RseP (regulator of RpoE activity)